MFLSRIPPFMSRSMYSQECLSRVDGYLKRYFSQKAFTSFTGAPFPDRYLVKDFSRFYETNLTSFCAAQHPKTMRKYWRVAQGMHQKGLVPFAHGQTALFFIPQYILNHLGYANCQLLRSSSDAMSGTSEIAEKIDAFMKERRKTLFRRITSRIFFTRFDHTPEMRKHLLSVTIGLFHNDFDESPLAFVYGGACSKYSTNPGNRSVIGDLAAKILSEEMLTEGLRATGFDDRHISRILEETEPLYYEAAEFHVGQLLAIGIPQDKLSTFAFHCKMFGIPTGIPIQEVLEKLAISRDVKVGYQARILLGKDALDPRSGIKVVNIMDDQAVEKFCEDLHLDEEEENEYLKDLLDGKYKSELDGKGFSALKMRLDGIIMNYLRK